MNNKELITMGNVVFFQIADITTGLVGHWAFDEGAGTTAGDSAGGNDGFLTNGTTWTSAGQINAALDFDGVNQTRVTANTIDNMTEFTVCVWVNPGSLTNADNDSNIHIFNKNYYLSFNNSGILSFTMPSSASYPSTNSSTSLITGTWQNVCVVYSGVGTTPRIYINSQDRSSGGTGGTGTQTDDSSSALYLGSSFKSVDWKF